MARKSHPDPVTEEKIQRLLTLRAVIESCRQQFELYTELKLDQKTPALKAEMEAYQKIYDMECVTLRPEDIPFLEQ